MTGSDQSRSSLWEETARVFARGAVMSQSTAGWILTQFPSPLPNFLPLLFCPILLSASPSILTYFNHLFSFGAPPFSVLFHTSLFESPFLVFILHIFLSFLSVSEMKGVLYVGRCCNQFSLQPAVVTSHSPGWLLLRGEGVGRVIAVCRWRACGSCWLWKPLCARDWMRRRICAQLWACCSESLPLSHSHRLVWLQQGCGPHPPDPGPPRLLVLKIHTHTLQPRNFNHLLNTSSGMRISMQ